MRGELLLRFEAVRRSIVSLLPQPGGPSENCCFGSKRSDGLTIPPGETATLSFILEAHEPGPFSGEGQLFIECDGLRILPFTVRGTATAP